MASCSSGCVDAGESGVEGLGGWERVIFFYVGFAKRAQGKSCVWVRPQGREGARIEMDPSDLAFREVS